MSEIGGGWELGVRAESPGAAARLANAWATASVDALQTAVGHAWRAADLQSKWFITGCELQPAATPALPAAWACAAAPEEYDPEQALTEIEQEAILSRGILPAMSFTMLQEAEPPGEALAGSRGMSVLAGLLAGGVVGVIAALGWPFRRGAVNSMPSGRAHSAVLGSEGARLRSPRCRADLSPTAIDRTGRQGSRGVGMSTRLRIGYDKIVDALWLMLLIAIPVTSFPPLVALVGGTPVAPLALVPLAGLMAIWLVPALLRGRKLPALVMPLLVFVGVALLAAAVALGQRILPLHGASVLGREARALLTLGIAVGFYLCAALLPAEQRRIRPALRARSTSAPSSCCCGRRCRPPS